MPLHLSTQQRAQRFAKIRHALLEGDADALKAYEHDAQFHAAVEAMASLAVEVVHDMAIGAQVRIVDTAERTDALARGQS